MHVIATLFEGALLTPVSGCWQAYLPDGLHPNAEGLKIIAQCLTPLLGKLIPSNATQLSNATMPPHATQPSNATQAAVQDLQYLGSRHSRPLAGKALPSLYRAASIGLVYGLQHA